MATVSAWLATQGLSMLLGFVLTALKTALDTYVANKNATALGQVTAERDQAVAGQKVESDLADEAAKRVSADDAIARLKAGTA
jgi:hypothetical protein